MDEAAGLKVLLALPNILVRLVVASVALDDTDTFTAGTPQALGPDMSRQDSSEAVSQTRQSGVHSWTVSHCRHVSKLPT